MVLAGELPDGERLRSDCEYWGGGVLGDENGETVGGR